MKLVRTMALGVALAAFLSPAAAQNSNPQQDMSAWVASVTEDLTFNCILAEKWKKLKESQRFTLKNYYEARGKEGVAIMVYPKDPKGEPEDYHYYCWGKK